MTLRSYWRTVRLYYKAEALGLYRAAFLNHRAAWCFPFAGRGAFVPRRGGKTVVVPRAHWDMLGTASRLVLLGAQPAWGETGLEVSYAGLCLAAPPTSKMLSASLREIFVEDAYHIGGRDLAGKTVVDIGAYIGDSSLAYAARGARVHAFEPLPRFRPYLERNVEVNGMRDRITVHPVGLGDADRSVRVPIETGSEEARFVQAVEYLRAANIAGIDILKMDCEGCEYGLLGDRRFLDQLRPEQIALEYHRGGEPLRETLGRLGYEVEWPRQTAPVGLMYARRLQK